MKKIIYLIQLPPPKHGVSTINEFIWESNVINADFDRVLIPLRFSNSFDELNRASLKKIVRMISVIMKLTKKLLIFRKSFVYFTINSTGAAFYRDVIFVILIKLCNGKPIYHLHGKGMSNRKNFIKKFLYQFIFSNAAIIHLSPLLIEQDFNWLTLKNAKFYAVVNGCFANKEIVRTHAVQTKPGIQILFLSTIMKSKGIFVLLESLRLLVARNNLIHLHVVGAAMREEELMEVKAFIKTHQLIDYVSLHGPQYDQKKSAIFSACDIFVHPTLNDAFPLVLLEAMEYGLPVVSTVEGAIPEIVVDGETGYLVPKNDVSQLTAKLEQLILNADLRTQMSKNARSRFQENYTADKFEQNMFHVFSQIAQRNSKGYINQK